MFQPLLICNIHLGNFGVTTWFSRKDYHGGVTVRSRDEGAHASRWKHHPHWSRQLQRSVKQDSTVESALSLEARDQNPDQFHVHVSNWAKNLLAIQKVDELEIGYSSNKCLTIIESNNFKTVRDINNAPSPMPWESHLNRTRIYITSLETLTQ